jgi:hypothetical protein
MLRRIWDLRSSRMNGSHTIVLHLVHESSIETYMELTAAGSLLVHVLVIGLVAVPCIVRSALSFP